MFDYTRAREIEAGSAVERGAVLGKVLGLLGVAFLCTAGGAFIGRLLGPGAFIISLIGSFGTLFALMAVREKAPINLWLMYAFATFEGMTIGLIVDRYIANGFGGTVLNAAATTGIVTLVAGTYGYTTKRDLARFGSFLFVALIAVVIASVIGIFIQMPLFHLVLSAIAAVLFTALLVFDLNRVARAKGATEGQIIMLAVSVYLDVINLFLAILRLSGGRR